MMFVRLQRVINLPSYVLIVLLAMLQVLTVGQLTPLQIPLALLMLFVLPGFMSLYVFPGAANLQDAEKAVMTIGLSLLWVIGGGFLFHVLNLPVNNAQYWSLYLAAIIWGCAPWAARNHWRAVQKASQQIRPSRQRQRELRELDSIFLTPAQIRTKGFRRFFRTSTRWGVALVAFALVGIAFWLSYNAHRTASYNGFTQLWILPHGPVEADDAERLREGLPIRDSAVDAVKIVRYDDGTPLRLIQNRVVNTTDWPTVIIGVNNRENETMSYHLQVHAGEELIGKYDLSLQDNTQWRLQLILPQVSEAENWPLRVELFTTQDPQIPYRSVLLYKGGLSLIPDRIENQLPPSVDELAESPAESDIQVSRPLPISPVATLGKVGKTLW